jgi:GTP-binding protein Era
MTDPLDSDGMLFEEQIPPGHQSGFVAVIGEPNVGKSTLMNQFLGEKLAIVSPRPQTTRANQLGILTRNDVQIVFVDTPGMHRAFNRLSEFMMAQAQSAVPDADVILFLVDGSEPPTEADRIIAESMREAADASILLVINKIDLLQDQVVQDITTQWITLVPSAELWLVSALTGANVPELLERIVALLPEGPRYYPADQLTETFLRDNVAEIIREKLLLLFEYEIPHAVAVQVEEFKERNENMTYIRATIYVERESQKAIVIGKQGDMLKEVGRLARPDIEELVKTRVYLDLWVKVLKNWRKNDSALKHLGYTSGG